MGLTWQERFWEKVNKSDTCWEWMAAKTSKGYGAFWVDRKMHSAHRLAWEIAFGSIPDGLQVDHRCHNRACVNASHLRLVTSAQNHQNRSGAAATSKTGVRGVCKHKNAWQVSVKLGGKSHYGGRFSSLAEAEIVAKELRARLFTHDDHDQWVAQ